MSNTDERVAFRIGEFAKIFGLSKSTIWNRINDGSLKTIRFGGATLIPATERDRILQESAAAE